MDEHIPGQVDMAPFRQMYVVVSALPTILLLLTFVLWFMFNNAEPTASAPAAVPPVQYVIFGVVALSTLPLAIWVRGMTLRQTGEMRMQNAASSAPQTMSADQSAVARITMASTIGMALPETSLLLGFVLGFMTQSWIPYVPFAAYTLLGWIVMYPRPEQVRRWFAEQTGTISPDAALPQPL